ncbi:sporulation-specific N-acetylmuramoyl-L-alanine amidase [Weizmannia acidilactici]|uniref:Sporulation-specific N-acetylmuramoyl-L-alanine amidase n=1 Tax=Weizmannia acidilactici TaxID=2607726 RepID=A0A5J4J6S2_9BACI|nr:N-acetylmuramoyl-L-alanine amidase [Weizmannia acidilactici]GER66740.1 sporulation-specific N-acetylmuramoyl-L-alanine amidase [Weizmannia acidilactici]GER70622.1 sporulation-specific N-acetylmuramoyl-L-alanine amidase [Weizmannia acidilactici]GER73795.1 sporulation-specific N-acetylmuramoyl-L-alanine amidase [Weizmannia acidilactici]
MFKLFLDPGHGGKDPGATGNGLEEKDITLVIGKKIRTILTNDYENVSVKMSRTTDTFISLEDRTDTANSWGADYFLSIHINSGAGTGFESYVYPDVCSPTTTYQKTIHQEVLKLNDLQDRGRKEADLHVLRESRMPALLTENGFIDRASDAAKMKQNSWIEDVAQGHVNGLAKAFGLKKKSGATYQKVVKGDTVYSLSKEYGSSIQQIKEWNNLDDDYTIYVGERLRVK